MALIKCPSCGADVSDQALQCPKCGHRFNDFQQTTLPVAQSQSGEPQKANRTKRLKQYVAIGIIIIICIQLFPRLISGTLSGAEIVQYALLFLLFFFAWLYKHLTKTTPSQGQNPISAPATPTATDLANWQETAPQKSFSTSVQMSTIVVSLFIIIISIIMLFAIPGKPESEFGQFAQKYMTDIFSPIKVGLYALIAANAIAMISAILNRNNNSHAVATGIIGTLIASGITILMNYSQNVSELEGYYHLFSGDADKHMTMMLISIHLAAIAVVIYMIIAACIAAARRRYVAGLMVHPTADKMAMQQYCSNRTAIVWLWALLSIAIIAALIFFDILLKSQH